MIEIQINTDRFRQKLVDAQSSISRSTLAGLDEAQQEIAAEVDRVMFVPLKFDSSVDKNSGTTNVSLDLQQATVSQRSGTQRKTFRRRLYQSKPRQFQRKRVSKSGLTWKQWVISLAIGMRGKIEDILDKSVKDDL